MKVCIYGAGAIGGLIGSRLAASHKCTVSAVARAATLDALREHGFRLKENTPSGATPRSIPVNATDDPRVLGVQDVIVIAVKGPALPAVAQNISPLLGSGTIVLPAMNGVPWWFGNGVPALQAAPLQSVDPGGRIAAAIPFASVVGCVVHASASTPAPGLVEHRMGHGLIIGEPAGEESARTRELGALLAHAGFEVTISTDIRRDIWYKLWGNLTMNPVSAITGATIDRALADPLVLEFCSAAMREAAAIGARIGCAIAQTPEDRHAVTRKLGAFKSSMQQDVEAGRAIELDAIVGVVREIAQRLHIATPNIDALLGLTRLFARAHGLYPDARPSTSELGEINTRQ
jgi:2-dehydropantoate 2-reductase